MHFCVNFCDIFFVVQKHTKFEFWGLQKVFFSFSPKVTNLSWNLTINFLEETTFLRQNDENHWSHLIGFGTHFQNRSYRCRIPSCVFRWLRLFTPNLSTGSYVLLHNEWGSFVWIWTSNDVWNKEKLSALLFLGNSKMDFQNFGIPERVIICKPETKFLWAT